MTAFPIAEFLAANPRWVSANSRLKAIRLAAGCRETASFNRAFHILQEQAEVIEVHWVPFATACEWALDGTIADAKTALGLLRARHIVARGAPPQDAKIP